ncbi:PIN domain-like protein [Mycena belliarum]|uniref:PIN domain-like protein n=1 Tax=Mycena belliarum TaxID=1033014 RepID=A0AAD6U2J3_9AGAR|nr:PIN domain-like protein [Mycena belliae]
MGIPKLWEIIDPAAESRSLLNLATVEGFKINNRGLRTFKVIGIDISIRINAIESALKAARVFHPGPGGQRVVLEKLFYQFCNLITLAPLTPVFVFDGPGRPSVKHGTRVVNRPAQLTGRLKNMITSFGFYFHDAPGEAEAELAMLNEHGDIDGIITEDSDTFVFGAKLVIRTSGPSVQDRARIYTQASIENKVSLDKDGFFLCALLIGGDYGPGIPGVGITVAHALAACGFGGQLAGILTSCEGIEQIRCLKEWRESLRQELRRNSSGRLGRRQLVLAEAIQETFPDLEIARLYLHPLTSRSPDCIGIAPSIALWKPREPSVPQLSAFCSNYFAWTGSHLLKKLNSNLWPGVAFQMICSRYILYGSKQKLFVSPSTQARLIKIGKARGNNHTSADLAPLDIHRVRVSANNFVALAGLDSLPPIAEVDLKLVSIPKLILAVATRDTSHAKTELSSLLISEEIDFEDLSDEGRDSDVGKNRAEDKTQEAFEVMDSDEDDLLKMHHILAEEGIIDLTSD